MLSYHVIVPRPCRVDSARMVHRRIIHCTDPDRMFEAYNEYDDRHWGTPILQPAMEVSIAHYTVHVAIMIMTTMRAQRHQCCACAHDKQRAFNGRTCRMHDKLLRTQLRRLAIDIATHHHSCAHRRARC